jgi:hypothetical protein
MKQKSIKDCIICWNRDKNDIEVQDIEFYKKSPRTHQSSWGGCNSEIFNEDDFDKRKALIFINAMHIIINYGVDAIAVHKALVAIDEYEHGCSDDLLYEIGHKIINIE